MKTQFSELEIGQRFHYNIDADGHEPYLYKVSETQAFVEHGYHSGLREDIAPDTEVWVWSEPVVLHGEPTEVERAALTILMGGRDYHPRADHVGLHYYIKALASDPDEMRSLDMYIWDTVVSTTIDGDVPLGQLCDKAGYVHWHEKWDHENSTYSAILNHESRGRQPANDHERYLALLDDAAARLASAIADYRVAGRPVGDQTHTISGMGSSLLSITTSLAAAVAEYHSRIVNAVFRAARV